MSTVLTFHGRRTGPSKPHTCTDLPGVLTGVVTRNEAPPQSNRAPVSPAVARSLTAPPVPHLTPIPVSDSYVWAVAFTFDAVRFGGLKGSGSVVSPVTGLYSHFSTSQARGPWAVRSVPPNQPQTARVTDPRSNPH